jgi:hypothetical protein
MFGSSRCTMPTPPVVDGISLIRFLHMLLTKGLRATIHDQHKRMGSVFTISFFGQKLTFLVGPEILSHFYQGPDSEISHGNMLDFMIPMFGKEVGYGVDFTTRYEQIRFYIDALTRPSKLRVHVGPMIQEVEVRIINYCANIFKPSDYCLMHIYFLEENLFFVLLVDRDQKSSIVNHLGVLYITYLNACMHRVHICYHAYHTSLVNL